MKSPVGKSIVVHLDNREILPCICESKLLLLSFLIVRACMCVCTRARTCVFFSPHSLHIRRDRVLSVSRIIPGRCYLLVVNNSAVRRRDFYNP